MRPAAALKEVQPAGGEFKRRARCTTNACAFAQLSPSQLPRVCPVCQKSSLRIEYYENDRWLAVRPQPVQHKGRFVMCSAYPRCARFNCSFAHGPLELAEWNRVEAKLPTPSALPGPPPPGFVPSPPAALTPPRLTPPRDTPPPELGLLFLSHYQQAHAYVGVLACRAATIVSTARDSAQWSTIPHHLPALLSYGSLVSVDADADTTCVGIVEVVGKPPPLHDIWDASVCCSTRPVSLAAVSPVM
jgi:hypothetical protein